MALLTQEEYQYWIEYVNKNYFPLPDITVKDMSNWRHRSVLARALARAREYGPAMELFQSIAAITVDSEEENWSGLSEVEDKAWCLKEMAVILWRTTGSRKEAVPYMEQARVLIETHPQQFQFLNRWEVWREIQEFIFFTSKGKSSNRSK